MLSYQSNKDMHKNSPAQRKFAQTGVSRHKRYSTTCNATIAKHIVEGVRELSVMERRNSGWNGVGKLDE